MRDVFAFQIVSIILLKRLDLSVPLREKTSNVYASLYKCSV